MANEHTPSTPSLKPTVNLDKFRFWCQKVLPLVYDDSLSYYEVLGKMVVYLNQVIDNINADTDNVLTLKEAFEELKIYVNSVIEYDVSDLEEAVREAVEASENATDAKDTAVEAAETAVAAKDAAQEAQRLANESANNASDSESNASEAEDRAKGYANAANQSALNAGDYANNASNSAQNASDKAKIAEGIAVGQENGSDVGSDSPYYQNNAKYYSENADDASENADIQALKAEGYSTGQQNGVDVGSDSPYYHKNAKYYAEQAGSGAGAVPLSELPDTLILNPTNGQVLAYDSTDQKWKNSDDVQGVTSLEALTDTEIAAPSGGQVLMYDATAQKWENSEEKEVAISPSAPSDPATKIWINETQQTPIVLATKADLDAVQEEVNNLDNAVGTKVNTSDFNVALSNKQNVTQISTQSAPSAVTVSDNYEYYLTNVANLAITFPIDNFECWLSIVTASAFTGITFPANVKYIGDVPEFAADETWEVSIKNGVVIAGKVE